jgi:hypothetical protein
MNLHGRVKKIEEATGINDPCWMCEVCDGMAREFINYLEARGAPLPQVSPADLLPNACPACGLAGQTNVAGYDESERALFLKSKEAVRLFYQGEIGFEESDALLTEFIEIAERKDEAQMGEHYKAAMAVSQKWAREFYGQPATIERMKRFAARRGLPGWFTEGLLA